jgi:hypothetical protein
MFCSLFAYNLFFFLNNTLVNMIRDCMAKRKREKQKQAKVEAQHEIFGVTVELDINN